MSKMKDLIYKDDAIDAIDGLCCGTVGWLEYAKDVVKKLQAADAVEVVRCKDCKWWDDGWCYCDDVDVRDQEYMIGDMCTEATHFCGYAKQREPDE